MPSLFVKRPTLGCLRVQAPPRRLPACLAQDDRTGPGAHAPWARLIMPCHELCDPLFSSASGLASTAPRAAQLLSFLALLKRTLRPTLRTRGEAAHENSPFPFHFLWSPCSIITLDPAHPSLNPIRLSFAAARAQLMATPLYKDKKELKLYVPGELGRKLFMLKSRKKVYVSDFNPGAGAVLDELNEHYNMSDKLDCSNVPPDSLAIAANGNSNLVRGHSRSTRTARLLLRCCTSCPTAFLCHDAFSIDH
eukprot:6213588-Pleurochrysis_carterae.AAC.9